MTSSAQCPADRIAFSLSGPHNLYFRLWGKSAPPRIDRILLMPFSRPSHSEGVRTGSSAMAYLFRCRAPEQLRNFGSRSEQNGARPGLQHLGTISLE